MRRLIIALTVVLAPAAAAAGWVLVTEPQPRSAAGWTLAAPMPAARGEVATAVVERDGSERAVVVGGFSGLRVSDRVDVYDPESDRWSAGPALPAPRHHPGAAGLGGDVYVAGGAATVLADAGERDLWVWRDGADTWEPLEPMPEARFAHRMVAADGQLFVVGGHGETARTLVYAPGAGWSSAADLPHARDHLGAVVVDGSIWVVGGRDDGRLFDRVDVYDIAADQWRPGPALPGAISGAAVGVVGGGVSVVGGEHPAGVRGWVSSRHRRLDLVTGRWAPAPAPVLGVHGAGDAVLGGRLYMFGGASRPGPWSVLSWSDRTQVYGGG